MLSKGGSGGSDTSKKGGLSPEQQKAYDEIVKANPSLGKEQFTKETIKFPENLYSDFFVASNKLDEKVISLIDMDPAKPVLIKSTPGIGKTEAGLHLASLIAKQNHMPFFAVTTRNMAWQAYDRIKGGFFGIGLPVIMLEGRHDGYVRTRYQADGSLMEINVKPNCHRYHEVCKARERGHPAQRYVCASCPYWPHYKDKHGNKTGIGGSCEYFKDLYRAAGIIPSGFGNWAPIVILTHKMFANVVCDSKIIKPFFLIADEDPIISMRDSHAWDSNELTRKIDGDELEQMRKLLDRTIFVAKKFYGLAKYKIWTDKIKALSDEDKILYKVMFKAREDYGTATLFGIALSALMTRAAKELDIDLEKVLEAASMATTGVEKGEFGDMSLWRFERVPYFKDPDLAEELHRVLKDAKEGKQVAYKASLRLSPDQPWAFYLDEVRKIGYGGPLVFLDAYGNPKIYERMCCREIDVAEIKCKMRKNVTVYHLSVPTSRKMMDDEFQRIAYYNEYVLPELRRMKGKKVLIYIQKRYVEWLGKKIEQGNFGLHSCIIKWFWMDRGDDSYGDFDSLIVFGSPFSNVAADEHFANALYNGEEVLDYSVKPGLVYNDERMQMLKTSRQTNELMQALFRLRPAKPRDDKQGIIILSQMQLPIEMEMPGAKKKTNLEQPFDFENISKGIYLMWKRFGCWTNMMSAFVYEAEALIKWFNSGGVESDLELPMSYYEMRFMFNRFKKNKIFQTSRVMLLDQALKLERKRITYRNQQVNVWGDEDSAVQFLEQIRLATREPGCDDENKEEQQQTPEPPPEPSEAEVVMETTTGGSEAPGANKGVFSSDVLKLMALLAEGEAKSVGGGGKTGPPNTS